MTADHECRECGRPVGRRRAPRRVDRLAMLRAIIEHIDRHGFAPAVRELARTADASSSVVVYNLERLEDAGLITRVRHVARSITVTELGRHAASDDGGAR